MYTNSINILMIDLGRDYGGAEKVIENLFNSSYDNMINMHLVCLDGTKFSNNILNNKNNTKNLLIENDKKKTLKNIVKIYKYIKKNDIQIIHCHGVISEIIGVFLSFITGKKVITTIHSRADFDTEKKLKGKAYCFIQKVLAVFNKKYIVVSQELKQFFLENKVSENKLLVINNGITPLEIQGCCQDEIFTVCTVGRLTAVKAHENLIKALAIVNKEKEQIKCIIAGEGELEQELKQLCAQEGLEKVVEFKGFISDVKTVFKQSHSIIMQSHMEGLPMVLLEAMSYKLPIIAYRVGGIKSLLDFNTCIELNDNSPEEIARKLQFCINNRNILIENCEKAYCEFKKNYDIEKFIETHKKLYKSII